MPTMTGSSPISIQAKCEPAPIVPEAIQIPKPMIPIEMENETASFMMASKDLCLSDRCQSIRKFRHQPGGLRLDLIIQLSKAAMPELVICLLLIRQP